MALTPGSQLGPYTIAELVGAGGMGEVYRGRDNRLGRDVAIKVLPDLLSSDKERLVRLEREAQLLASLNHPNIAQIYGLEQVGTTCALVMEFVPGETLGDAIARGAMPPHDALPIARKIGDALQAAHDRGIIHRDLKPANIKVSPEGHVKVLDFGLAKGVESSGASPGRMDSPTISAHATQAGVILGTAAYMSPEQARGKPLDKRTDIFSFGCVLFEMLTGVRAFDGEDVTSAIAAVVRAEPDWGRLPAETPPSIRRLLRRCLEKDRDERLPDIGVVRLEIKDAAETSAPAALRPAPAGRERLAWGAAAILGILALVAGWIAANRSDREPAAIRTVSRSTIVLPPNVVAVSDPSTRYAISPDGRRLAFVARSGDTRSGPWMIWIRPVDDFGVQPLAGTEGATAPFWSPDSRQIAFFSGNRLRRIDAGGGSITTICELPGKGGEWGAYQSGTWSREGVLLFTYAAGLSRVSERGGSPVAVTTLEGGETVHAYPAFLPDSRHFLYHVRIGEVPSGVFLASIDGGSRQRVLEDAGNAVFADGFLLFPRAGALFAQRFDPVRLVTAGEASVVAEPVVMTIFNTASFSASETGTLIYVPPPSYRLVWFDRSGNRLGTVGDSGAYWDVQLSPDDRYASVSDERGSPVNRDIYVIDLKGGLPRQQVTTDARPDYGQVWSPHGRKLAFVSNRKGVLNLYVRDLDGPGPDEPLVEDEGHKLPMSWSPNGYLLYRKIPSGALWVWDFGQKRSVQVMTGGADAQFSHDGRWLAFVRGGRVFVAPFSEPDKMVPISAEAGAQPRWSRDGRELFCILKNHLVAVPLSVNGTQVVPGIPQELFEMPIGLRSTRIYAVTSDGQRFLVREPDPSSPPAPITLMTNWSAGMAR